VAEGPQMAPVVRAVSRRWTGGGEQWRAGARVGARPPAACPRRRLRVPVQPVWLVEAVVVCYAHGSGSVGESIPAMFAVGRARQMFPQRASRQAARQYYGACAY